MCAALRDVAALDLERGDFSAREPTKLLHAGVGIVGMDELWVAHPREFVRAVAEQLAEGGIAVRETQLEVGDRRTGCGVLEGQAQRLEAIARRASYRGVTRALRRARRCGWLRFFRVLCGGAQSDDRF
jgi:hypothetical protein